MTIKDIYNNEELVNTIVEDIDDIPEDTEVGYEVWALGFTADGDVTDDEVLLGEFIDPDAAIKCVEATTIERINEMGFGERDEATEYFSVEVETVVADPEDVEGTVNIGTIYSRYLYLYGCDNEVEDDEVEETDPIVAVTADDYTITEDGILKVSCELLKGFNEGDQLRIQFVGEPESVSTLAYKIISKVGDYYHLDFML